MTMALEGLRMIDLTENLAGPFCSMLLADMGVEAIKIERLGVGDNTRGQAPQPNGFSLPFTMVNRNKKSLTVNLKDQRGQEIIRRLALTADILLENYRPGTMDDLGLGFADLSPVNPRLIYASISGFGQTSPYREQGGFDLIAQAMSGLMSVTGEPGQRPAKAGYPVTDLGTGMFGAYGVLCALQARERTGRGQHVDTSLFECGVAWSVWQSAKYLGTGEVPGPMGSAHPLSAPYQAVQAQDKYFIIGAGNQRLFRSLCELIGHPEWADDPRFATQPARMENQAELAGLLETVFRTNTAEYWLGQLREAGIPCGPINNVAEMLADPHAIARGMVVDIDHPVAGPTKVLGNPVKLSETPATIRQQAPKLGEHTDEVLTGLLGYSPGEIEVLRAERVI
ncbi:MAG TPA: CoA transferase [Dehalococcoidia bacterium]|nr:CoA transferase [Dehalococcoidia bacterium]